jgi:hypothetical protein
VHEKTDQGQPLKGAVEKLWTNGEFLVDHPTSKFFFAMVAAQNPAWTPCARAFVTRFACLRRRNT